MAADRTLITVAPTGAEADKAAVPALPVTLAELVLEAKECEAAGAAVIHVHVRDDAARPTLEVGRLTDTVAALREGTGLIVQLSTGGAVTDSFASAGRPGRRAGRLLADLRHGQLRRRRVQQPVAVHQGPVPADPGASGRPRVRAVRPGPYRHPAPAARSVRAAAGGHVHCDLVMGVPGGMPGDVATLAAAVAALPAGATWSATGIGRTTLPVLLGALGARADTCASAWRTR